MCGVRRMEASCAKHLLVLVPGVGGGVQRIAQAAKPYRCAFVAQALGHADACTWMLGGGHVRFVDGAAAVESNLYAIRVWRCESETRWPRQFASIETQLRGGVELLS